MDKKDYTNILQILYHKAVKWWREKHDFQLEEQDTGDVEKADEIEIWIGGLAHEQWRVRLEAIEVLGKIGDVRAIEPLIHALEDEHLDVRVGAIIALGKRGDGRAVEPLITLLEDKEWTVRRNAAEALGRIGDPRAVEPLIQTLSDWAIRGNAVRALGKLGDDRATMPLIEVLEDKNGTIRAATAEALGKIGDTRAILPLIQVLGDEYPAARTYTEKAIEKIAHTQTIGPLIAALDDKQPTVRKEAARILTKIGDIRAVKPLIGALEDTDRDVRATAAEALGEIGDTQAIEPLIATLGAWDIQWTVVNALDKLGWTPENETEKVFYFLAKKERYPLVALGAPAIEPLRQILTESDSPSFTRKEVAEALQAIYTLISGVIFGSHEFRTFDQWTFVVCNPDVSELDMPMSALKKIMIYTEAYDFHLVERFITYAVNYIGQDYLRKHVEVHIYGDPDKLHLNLRNSLENLCKLVILHKG